MGHDIHFLQRLDRVNLPHVELAMSLYNDTPLTQYILSLLKLPDAVERVAFALDDSETGPFVIVTRAGHFVTCLGEGMRVGPEMPVVTRGRLDALMERIETYRERVAQATRDAGALGKGRVKQLLRRIVVAGDDLSREEFVAISCWQPLLRLELLQMYYSAAMTANTIRESLTKLNHPPKHYQEPLRQYWNMLWGAGHLALLVGMDVRPLLEEVPPLQESMNEQVSMTWMMTRLGFTPQALRAGWLAAKLGNLAMPAYKRAHHRAQTLAQQTDSCLGLVSIAARHSGLRGEIRKALPRTFPEPMAAEEVHQSGVLVSAEVALTTACDAPDEYLRIVKETAEHLYLKMTNQVVGKDPPTPEQRATVPEDLLLCSLALPPQCFVYNMNQELNLLMMLPFAVRAKPEHFYFPRAELSRILKPWQPEDSVELLKLYRQGYYGGAPKPVRAEPTPGRNDACPCKSGKKYKRCCALTGGKPASLLGSDGAVEAGVSG